mmetsp:Transcript_7321/g.13692  ORF Transcript_7321/g.13692 Transcript_7321/m.13692 type:complete len:342 (+) Transcript_7321:52-1077(+)
MGSQHIEKCSQSEDKDDTKAKGKMQHLFRVRECALEDFAASSSNNMLHFVGNFPKENKKKANKEKEAAGGCGTPPPLYAKLLKDKWTRMYVLHDEKKNFQGTGTISVEPKLIHECGSVGHLLNVKAKSSKIWPNVAQALLPTLLSRAKEMGCYKCLFDCEKSQQKTLEANGFKTKHLQMTATLTESQQKGCLSVVPGKFQTRFIQTGDYDKGFVELLGQLTSVGVITRDKFEQRVADISNRSDQCCVVVEDLTSNRIVGTASVLVLAHFPQNIVGHIEDVVVDVKSRGQGLGRIVVEEMLRRAALFGCGSCSLNCSQKNSNFYAKFGFKVEKIGMAYYFDE